VPRTHGADYISGRRGKAFAADNRRKAADDASERTQVAEGRRSTSEGLNIAGASPWCGSDS
jgi:hypothetical protein